MNNTYDTYADPYDQLVNPTTYTNCQNSSVDIQQPSSSTNVNSPHLPNHANNTQQSTCVTNQQSPVSHSQLAMNSQQPSTVSISLPLVSTNSQQSPICVNSSTQSITCVNSQQSVANNSAQNQITNTSSNSSNSVTGAISPISVTVDNQESHFDNLEEINTVEVVSDENTGKRLLCQICNYMINCILFMLLINCCSVYCHVK